MIKHRPNFALMAAILLLVVVGSVLISSASIVLSKQATGSPNAYFYKHLAYLLIGFGMFYVGFKIDYHYWKKIAPYLLLGALVLMVAVFIPGIGVEINGARRWIGGPLQFAPAEVFKFALVAYLATWLDKLGDNVKSFWFSVIPFILILALAASLIIFQPDMGTMLIVTATAGVMYMVAGASMTHIAGLIAAGVACVIALIKIEPYRMARFTIFMNPTADQSGAGYQINQALLAIGTGGLFGVGFGQSRQKFNYLPEAATDSIFAVTAEELGFFRAGLIVLAFLVVAYNGYKVAEKAPDKFGRLLAVGITTWITFQALLNIAAMLSLVPLTGVPLPFISMGSSSTIMLLFASGILINISQFTTGETRESRSNRRRNWWSYLTGLSRN
jgi:cell division protein FtsW